MFRKCDAMVTLYRRVESAQSLSLLSTRGFAGLVLSALSREEGGERSYRRERSAQSEHCHEIRLQRRAGY